LAAGVVGWWPNSQKRRITFTVLRQRAISTL